MTKFKVGDLITPTEERFCGTDISFRTSYRVTGEGNKTIAFIDDNGDERSRHISEYTLYKPSIRDVQEGDIVIFECDEYEVLAVGKTGFVLEDTCWHTWDRAEQLEFKIKQDIKEMTVAEINKELGYEVKIVK